jgi:hypothetical protein
MRNPGSIPSERCPFLMCSGHFIGSKPALLFGAQEFRVC